MSSSRLPVLAPEMSLNSNNMEFFNQWSNRPDHAPQAFSEPTCTVPNQSMTVQEIIAKYSRTGLVPQSYLKKDTGGNAATDPEFDPLDSGFDLLESAAAARNAANSGQSGAEGTPSGGAGEPGGASAPADAGKEGVSEL